MAHKRIEAKDKKMKSLHAIQSPHKWDKKDLLDIEKIRQAKAETYAEFYEFFLREYCDV